MAKRRAWVTPNSPAPEETRGRCFSVPNDNALVGAVTGALLPLTLPENWEKQGTMSADEAASIMSLAFEAFVNGTCGDGGADCVPGGTPVIRKAANGKFQTVNSEGEWDIPTGELATEPPEVRPEETEPEQRCGAASNAVNVLKLTYLDMVTAFDESADNVYGIAQLGLSLASSLSAGLSAQVTAYLALTDFIFSVFYAAIETITADYWTDEFTSVLVCTLQDNLELVDGVAEFDYQGVLNSLVGVVFPIVDEFTGVRWQVWYLLQFIGAEGLNLAGATQSVEGDCASCGEWCITHNLEWWDEYLTIYAGAYDSEGQLAVSGDPTRVFANMVLPEGDYTVHRATMFINGAPYPTYGECDLYHRTGADVFVKTWWEYGSIQYGGDGVTLSSPDNPEEYAAYPTDILQIRLYGPSGSYCRFLKLEGVGTNPFAGSSNC